MTWILTNDDGIDAPGLEALAAAVTEPVLIVAPQTHQSGCGHQVTTTRPIAVEQRTPHSFAVDGTPADCVRLALSQLCPAVSLVLSGINAGANLGVDSYISGTVAAVREAAFHRIPGIAFSQYRQGNRPIDWQRSQDWTTAVLQKLLSLPLAPDRFWNVNLPHLLPDDPDPEIVFCSPCTCPLPIAYRRDGAAYHYVGRYADRQRVAGTDVEVCFAGAIAVTQICL